MSKVVQKKELKRVSKKSEPKKNSAVKAATTKQENVEVKVAPKPEAKAKKAIKTVLITQPRPESDKSPYFQLEKKYNIQLDFCPFILVEGISARDFRAQRVDITDHSAVIFNSRNAIDHFFRLCEESKIKISPEMKYFCITESIALYLQKFIVYRKRKIFYGLDGTVNSMLEVITKHKSKEKYIVPVNDICRTEILDCLQKNNLEYSEVIYIQNSGK
jgi:uroporphyrinogen-III synthase